MRSAVKVEDRHAAMVWNALRNLECAQKGIALMKTLAVTIVGEENKHAYPRMKKHLQVQLIKYIRRKSIESKEYTYIAFKPLKKL